MTRDREFIDPIPRTFEDFALGDVIRTRGRTVETSDFIAFAGLTGDHYPLHTDEAYAAGTRFGTRLAHGPLTFSIAVGLVGMTGYYGDGIVALLEVTRLRALAPVRAGDTLRVRAEVTGHEAGENPRYGTLTVEYSVHNQREEEVMHFTQVMLARRASGPATVADPATVPPLTVDAGAPNDPLFIGIGEIPSGKFPDRSFMGAISEVAIRALADAHVAVSEVDTIMLIPCLHSFDDQADLVFSRMVEELGLQGQAKSCFMVHSGGSTSDNAVRVASGLIASGHARTVLVLQAERWGSADLEEMVTMLTLNGIPQEWERASGMSFNAIGALIHQRYMHDTGSTAEDMAGVCVSLRRWANLNPNAMFRDRELTVEKVLASKMICDPLHAMECPPLADGAAAFVMTSRENAERRVDRAVRIAGSGGCVSHYSIGQERNLSRLGWKTAAERAYAQSGWGPDDAQFGELYDSYAAVTTIAAEALGLCPEGEGARWIASGATSPGGAFPLNTNGGLLSAGHTGVGGGTALLVEGVRQLMGKAGPERQIADVTRGVIGGTGGSYMDSQVLLLEQVELGGGR